jgi:hypothetical protein
MGGGAVSPEAFRAELAALGHTQAGFARLLSSLGHPAKDVARSVRRWCEIGPPGEAVVMLRLLRMVPLSEAVANDPARRRAETIAAELTNAELVLEAAKRAAEAELEAAEAPCATEPENPADLSTEPPAR